MRANVSGRRMGGFTVIEMMVVVAIIAILSMLAVPSMRDMITTQRVKTASFDMFAGLVLARSEAIKRNTSVPITPNGGDWALGFVATDAHANVLSRQDAFIPSKGGVADLPPGGMAPLALVGPATVTFNSMGRSTALATFAITAPDIPNTSYRCIKLDLSGRPVSLVGTCPP